MSNKESTIQKVAVIGSGVMGSGIAAQIANAGFDVILMDIVPQGAADRSMLAKNAIQKLLKDKPAAFMHPRFADRVQPANIEDDIALLGEADWIIEVVIEKKEIKRDLYKKIDAVRKKGSIVSSNTSTIPVHSLVEGFSESFQQDFLITHFFNPPRYMRLIEIVVGSKTNKAQQKRVTDFVDYHLGKGVAFCKDSPAFIANRIGIYWIQCAFNGAVDQGLTVEEADAVMSRPFGFPKTGVFGLADLVGIDLMPHLAVSLKDSLPASDAYNKLYRPWPLLDQMIKDGYTGRKGKGGFYRLDPESKGEKKVKQSINLKTGVYQNSEKASLPSTDLAKKNLAAFLDAPDKAGLFARKAFLAIAHYVLEIASQVADDIFTIDEAMKMGYNWKYGPFELMDRVGTSWLKAAFAKDGYAVPAMLEAVGSGSFYKIGNNQRMVFDGKSAYTPLKRAENVILLEDLKLTQKPVKKNASAAIWDIGDGVLCFEFQSKMNSVDDQILGLLLETISLIKNTDSYKALVVYNEADQFSVGVNLGMVMFLLNLGLWTQAESAVEQGQMTYEKLKYAPFPVVGAPAGMALGGGCEILLHCDAVCAYAESYIGLVEVGVGVIPGWGGCKELLRRWDEDTKSPKGPMPKVMKAFETISMAKVSTSAAEAYDLKYLRKGIDEIVMNRDRLLATAKTKALSMVDNYQAPEKHIFAMPGQSGKVAIQMAIDGFKKQGIVLPHDEVVLDRLANVLTGGSVDMTDPCSEEEILKLEIANIVPLFKTEGTMARIEHMLTTGKPLRN